MPSVVAGYMVCLHGGTMHWWDHAVRGHDIVHHVQALLAVRELVQELAGVGGEKGAVQMDKALRCVQANIQVTEGTTAYVHTPSNRINYSMYAYTREQNVLQHVYIHLELVCPQSHWGSAKTLHFHAHCVWKHRCLLWSVRYNVRPSSSRASNSDKRHYSY